jgi:hypothetical protein
MAPGGRLACGFGVLGGGMRDAKREYGPAPVLHPLVFEKYLRDMGLDCLDQPVKVRVAVDTCGGNYLPLPQLLVNCACRGMQASITGNGSTRCGKCGSVYELTVQHEPGAVVALIRGLPAEGEVAAEPFVPDEERELEEAFSTAALW